MDTSGASMLEYADKLSKDSLFRGLDFDVNKLLTRSVGDVFSIPSLPEPKVEEKQ